MLTGKGAGGHLQRALEQRDTVRGEPTLRNLLETARTLNEAQCVRELEMAIQRTLEGYADEEPWSAVARLDCFVVIADRVIEECVRWRSRFIKRQKLETFDEYISGARPLIDASLVKMLAPPPVHEFIIQEVEASLCKEYILVRAARLFDDILDYTDSAASLRELRKAITNSPGALRLIWDRLAESIHKRLLHVAIDVMDIAGQVALSVEPLRIVDPSGYLIDRLCREVKQYLDPWRRGWKGQFMSFYLKLVREPQFEDEFIRLEQLTFDLSDVVFFTKLPESWQADPIEALHDPVTMSSKCGSTLDILANFFESAGDFITEYQKHLMDTLLRAGPTADINELITEFEMLKAKIPSPSWGPCEVMFHDRRESVKEGLKVASSEPFRLIISSHYWPMEWPKEFKEVSVTELLPVGITKRQNQVLRWRYPLDRFDLAIDFKNGTFSFPGTTFHQKLILELADTFEGPRPLDDFLIPSGSDGQSSWDALQFWLKNRVLIMTADNRIALADLYDPTMTFSDALIQINDAPERSASERQAAAEVVALDKYWSYIQAMLTNLGPMKSERIHATLSMFASDYKGSLGSLEAFLNHRLQLGDLFSDHGSYQVGKK